MTIDPTILDYLQQDFRAEMGLYEYRPNPSGAEVIRERLKNMGLDLDDDATYELLQDNLTKQDFDDLEILSLSHYIVRRFYNSQNLSWVKHPELMQQEKYKATQELVDLLDVYRDFFKERPLPDDCDPMHRQIMEQLFDDYDNNKIQNLLPRLQLNAASEILGNLKLLANIFRDEFDFVVEHGQVVEQIKVLHNTYTSLNDEQKRQFRDENDVNDTELNNIIKNTALRALKGIISFEPDPIPYYMGHNAAMLAYQYTLDTLETLGIEKDDPDIYKGLGIKKDEFWNLYKQQRDWIEKTMPATKTKKHGPPAP